MAYVVQHICYGICGAVYLLWHMGCSISVMAYVAMISLLDKEMLLVKYPHPLHKYTLPTCIVDEEGMGHLLDPEDVDALFEVVKSAKAKWRDIGRELGFTLREMDDIVAKKGISQDQDYFQELLDLWLNWAPPEKSFPCTEDLLEALRHIGQHRLAMKLEQRDDFMGKKGLIKRKPHPSLS